VAGRLVLAGICTVAPILVLIGVFALRDVRREPLGLLLSTFLVGLLSVLPALMIAVLASLAPVSSPWWGAAYGAFAVAATPEELLKFLVIRGFSARQPAFDETMDGLVYGVTAALGFAALENALYVIQGGWLTAVLRAVTAVPMHAATGAILGYGVARSRFGARSHRTVYAGLSAAILVHGLYDFALIATALVTERGTAPNPGEILFPVAACAVLVAAVGWSLGTARRLRREQLASLPTAKPPSKS
jgi:RsiW-degrading membrane proteinase PrsW (M82 family)